jgi:hypothetical protein
MSPVAQLGSVKGPIPIILDTDIAPDCDDAGDIAVLHRLALLGECTIKAVIICASDLYATGTVNAINTYYGSPDIPIGQNKGTTFLVTSVFNALVGNLGFPNSIKTRDQAEIPLNLYRRTLANSARKITIVSTGPLNTLSELLQSSADGYSALTGAQLIAAKVERLIITAGYWPNSASPEWNLVQDKTAANYVFANWPGQIDIIGCELGETVDVGGGLTANTPLDNPVRRVYEAWLNAENATRPAWGQLAVLHAVRRGIYFSPVANGTGVVNPSTGANTWTTGAGTHTYYRKVYADSVYEDLLNGFLNWCPPDHPLFANVLIQHSFTGADGTAIASLTPDVGAAWAAQRGDWVVANNKITTSGSASGSAWWVATKDSGRTSLYAEALIQHSNLSGTRDGVIFRYQDINNFMFAGINNSSITIAELVSNTENIRASCSGSFSNNTEYKIKVLVRPDNKIYASATPRTQVYWNSSNGSTRTIVGLRSAGSVGQGKADTYVVKGS